ncbi:MAG: hypothetical protein ACREI7_10650, partial [Myxococcota bacterium]
MPRKRMRDRGARGCRPGGFALALVALAGGCAREDGGALEVAPLVHLADRLDAAVVEAADPAERQSERVWRFDGARPDWRSVSSADRPDLATLERTQLSDGVRLALSLPRSPRSPIFIAGLAVALDGLDLDDWESVLVRARSSDRFGGVTVAYNLDEPGGLPNFMHYFVGGDDVPPIFNDGSTQTYA